MSLPDLELLFIHQVITIPRIHKYYFPRNARLGKKVPKIGGSRNPGNFRIFITPKKFTSFYSKDFLPKLIFLRKGVHHPKSGFPGVVAKFPDGFSFLGTPRILNFITLGKIQFWNCQIYRLATTVYGFKSIKVGFITEFKI
jgi:hypothetical protein